MKPIKVEIVPALRRGVTGYANVGRGTPLGNPYTACEYHGNHALVVALYSELFRKVPDYRKSAMRLLDRDWPDGIVRIGCPCNGVLKGQPCHAAVIKGYLEAQIERRAS